MSRNLRKINYFNSLFLMFFIPVSAMAQAKSPVHNFPRDFIGNWKGSLTWYPAGKELQRVNMQLNIQPDPLPSQYSWHLIYGDSAKDNRPYHLKPVDSAAGHWIVDENNGIILDGYFIGNRFISSFEVQGSTITAIYWIEEKSLFVEMISTKSEGMRKSGKGTAELPLVSSFPVRSYQKAILHKSQ